MIPGAKRRLVSSFRIHPCAFSSSPDARPFLATGTGVSQDFTGLVAAVQLRLRGAFGLQALQQCSGLLNRRARGSTVATHQLGKEEG